MQPATQVGQAGMLMLINLCRINSMFLVALPRAPRCLKLIAEPLYTQVHSTVCQNTSYIAMKYSDI